MVSLVEIIKDAKAEVEHFQVVINWFYDKI